MLRPSYREHVHALAGSASPTPDTTHDEADGETNIRSLSYRKQQARKLRKTTLHQSQSMSSLHSHSHSSSSRQQRQKQRRRKGPGKRNKKRGKNNQGQRANTKRPSSAAPLAIATLYAPDSYLVSDDRQSTRRRNGQQQHGRTKRKKGKKSKSLKRSHSSHVHVPGAQYCLDAGLHGKQAKRFERLNDHNIDFGLLSLFYSCTCSCSCSTM
jgi:hypothetical protein